MSSNTHQESSGGPFPEVDTGTAPPGAQSPAEIAPPADPVARLEAELEAARAEIGQWRDRFLRKAAELENFRKRTERERGEAAVCARSAVLAEILPVVDGFERALESLAAQSDLDSGLAQYREGVRLLYRQLTDTLARLGVTPLDTVGRPFDPHFHEALAKVESAEHPENTVVSELRKGYLLHDRLLRPAQVTVATAPKGEKRPES